MPWAFSVVIFDVALCRRLFFLFKKIISTGDPSSTNFVTSSKIMTFLLEIHVEMVLSKLLMFNKKTNQLIFNLSF